MKPQDMNIKGATQPEIFQGVVDEMVAALLTDPEAFWQKALDEDGLVEVWEINGERFLFNGNHRYQAASRAGVEIPDSMVDIKNQSGSNIPTFYFHQMVWMPGVK